jgi:hypothetical protein
MCRALNMLPVVGPTVVWTGGAAAGQPSVTGPNS